MSRTSRTAVSSQLSLFADGFPEGDSCNAACIDAVYQLPASLQTTASVTPDVIASLVHPETYPRERQEGKPIKARNGQSAEHAEETGLSNAVGPTPPSVERAGGCSLIQNGADRADRHADEYPQLRIGSFAHRRLIDRVVSANFLKLLAAAPWEHRPADDRNVKRQLKLALLDATIAAQGFENSVFQLRTAMACWAGDRYDPTKRYRDLLNEQNRARRAGRALGNAFRVTEIADRVPLAVVVAGLDELESAMRFDVLPTGEIHAGTQNPPLAEASDSTEMLLRKPVPWQRNDPPLALGVNGSFFGLDNVHPDDLRSVIVLGESGSGKTVSAVMPYLNAAVQYCLANGKKAAVLVLDGKKELGDPLVKTLAERGEADRLVQLGKDVPPIAFFQATSQLSMADRRHKIEAFQTRMNQNSGADDYWQHNSLTKIYQLCSLQKKVSDRYPQVRLLQEWAKAIGIAQESRNTWVLLADILPHLCGSGRSGLRAANLKLKELCQQYGIPATESTVLDMYTAADEAFTQFLYVVTVSVPRLDTLSNRKLLDTIDLDPAPDPLAKRTDILSLVELEKVILLQPDNTESAKLAAKAVKGKYFEAVFARQDQERPVITVADEAHRFFSHDPMTGEAAFLDRCRGYRGMVLYATQSWASLRHELGSGPEAQSAVDIVVANTPTKIILRSTDETTVNWLRAVIPPCPDGGPHVVDVRRPVEFKPGQGYLIQASGHWALRQSKLQ